MENASNWNLSQWQLNKADVHIDDTSVTFDKLKEVEVFVAELIDAYNDQHDICYIVFGVYLSLLTQILGIVGCTIAYLVFCKFHDYKSPSIFLLKALMFADGSYLVVLFFFRGLWEVYLVTGSEILAPVYKYSSYVYLAFWLYPLSEFVVSPTSLILILVCVTRYIAVCKPFKVKQLISMKNARIGVGICYLYALIGATGLFFTHELVTKQAGNSTIVLKVRTRYGTNVVYQTFFLVTSEILHVFLVVFGLLFINYKIISSLKKMYKSRKENLGISVAPVSRNTGLTVTLVLNSAIVVLVKAARVTRMAIGDVYRVDGHRSAESLCAWKVIDTLHYLSSGLDCLLFTVCCREFREILFQQIQHLVCRKPVTRHENH